VFASAQTTWMCDCIMVWQASVWLDAQIYFNPSRRIPVATIKKKASTKPMRQAAPARHKTNGMSNGYASVADEAQILEPVSHASRRSSFVNRGKDLLAGEAGSVATAAAIVVGAALIEIELIPGLIIGAGAIMLGKLFPELGSYARPMVKGVLRAGFSVSQKAREVMAEANEQVHDLVAEVKHEHASPAPGTAPSRRKPAAKKATSDAAMSSEMPAH
jgi:hypothetical protein